LNLPWQNTQFKLLGTINQSIIEWRCAMTAFKIVLIFCIVGCFGACVTATTVKSAPSDLFRDELFGTKPAAIDAREVFKLSEPMQQYLQTHFAARLKSHGRARMLYAALFTELQLKLEYDSQQTRTASGAFAARSGNCLSLVIMTAALAKALSLDVHFHGVQIEENWLRKDDLFFSTGHVNISIGQDPQITREVQNHGRFLIVDFVPTQQLRHMWPLTEQTIVAMYLNNRAAEIMTQGDFKEAYWWAKAAIQQDSQLWPAYISLGVIYRRSGHPELSEQALRRVLENDPNNITALSNLANVLAQLKRTDDLSAVREHLKQLRPVEPYYYFKLGNSAMLSGDFERARDLYLREVRRQPHNPEFHFQLALAYLRLGDSKRAADSMSEAQANSTSAHEQGIYAAKLSRMRAH
jgi:tetratricopeptide (TPR) repeat protein